MSPLAAPRTRSRAALAAATAATALALTACTSTTGVRPVAGQATASGVVGSLGAPAGTSSGGAVASTTPSPSTLTAEAYRTELQQARGPVRDALRKLADTG